MQWSIISTIHNKSWELKKNLQLNTYTSSLWWTYLPSTNIFDYYLQYSFIFFLYIICLHVSEKIVWFMYSVNFREKIHVFLNFFVHVVLCFFSFAHSFWLCLIHHFFYETCYCFFRDLTLLWKFLLCFLQYMYKQNCWVSSNSFPRRL